MHEGAGWSGASNTITNQTNGVITMNTKTNIKAGRALLLPAVQKVRG